MSFVGECIEEFEINVGAQGFPITKPDSITTIGLALFKITGAVNGSTRSGGITEFGSRASSARRERNHDNGAKN